MNAIDRKRLVQRLERDADAEAWADEFLYKHPKFIAGIVYYANRMLEEIESGAFDIKSPEVPTLEERNKLIEGLRSIRNELDRLSRESRQKWKREGDMYEQGRADAYDEADVLIRDILKECGVTVD